jgi:hypothetical protein
MAAMHLQADPRLAADAPPAANYGALFARLTETWR